MKIEGVYFLVCDITNLCKIGYSADIRKRTNNIRNMCPTKLKRYYKDSNNGRALEKKLHKRFSSSRRHGEWFNYTVALKTYVENGYRLDPSHHYQNGREKWILRDQ
jgi:hypothetical protein